MLGHVPLSTLPLSTLPATAAPPAATPAIEPTMAPLKTPYRPIVSRR